MVISKFPDLDKKKTDSALRKSEKGYKTSTKRAAILYPFPDFRKAETVFLVQTWKFWYYHKKYSFFFPTVISDKFYKLELPVSELCFRKVYVLSKRLFLFVSDHSYWQQLSQRKP